MISSKEPSPVPPSPEVRRRRSKSLVSKTGSEASSSDSENSWRNDDAIFEGGVDEDDINARLIRRYSIVETPLSANREEPRLPSGHKPKKSRKKAADQQQLIADWYDFPAIMRNCIQVRNRLFKPYRSNAITNIR